MVPHELISFQTDCDKGDDNFKLVSKTTVVTAEQMVLYGGNEVPDSISHLVSHAAFPIMCPTLHGLPHDTYHLLVIQLNALSHSEILPMPN